MLPVDSVWREWNSLRRFSFVVENSRYVPDEMSFPYFALVWMIVLGVMESYGFACFVFVGYAFAGVLRSVLVLHAVADGL